MVKVMTSLSAKITGVSDNFFYWAIVLFVFLIPISQTLSAKALFIAVVLSLFASKKSKTYISLLRNSWDILIYLFVLCVGLLYSANLNSGFRVLETNLSFIGIPIIFWRLDERKMKDLLLWFALGLCLSSSICLINATLVYLKTGNVDSFFFYKLTDVLGFQPTYFAYYLIGVISYGLYLIYYQLTKINTLLILFVVLFLFVVLILTGGETSFVSVLLIFSFFILKFIVEKKSIIKTIIVSLIGVMLFYMFTTTVMGNDHGNSLLDDAWDRLAVWESGIEATPNLLFGAGTGDSRDVLKEFYLKHDLKEFAAENYNSHNQFIQLLFSNGVLGIVAFIILIGRPLYLSSKNHSLIGVLLVFPFLIYGITEVFLGRYQGVVFFALVHQLSVLQASSHRFSDLKT